MIQFTDLITHPQMPFEQYMEMPYKSHSWLKYNINGVMPFKDLTNKMALGKCVDAFITGESNIYDFDSETISIARPIAAFLMAKFGVILDKSIKQAVCTGTATYKGIKMRIKTRIDFLIPKVCTIDLKVSGCTNFEENIQHMGYGNQVFIQTSLADVPRGWLLIYSTKTKGIYFRPRPKEDAHNWLINKILEHGE